MESQFTEEIAINKIILIKKKKKRLYKRENGLFSAEFRYHQPTMLGVCVEGPGGKGAGAGGEEGRR